MVTISKKTLKQVVLDKRSVIDACVQLVTTNGRPFQLLDDSGFKMIMNPICNAIGDGKLMTELYNRHTSEYLKEIVSLKNNVIHL